MACATGPKPPRRVAIRYKGARQTTPPSNPIDRPADLRPPEPGGSTMSQKVFVLGIGCQKGGTTWLHAYLAAHPMANMGFTKEYHVLDVHHVEESQEFRRATEHRIAEDRNNNRPPNPSDLHLLEFYNDLEKYHDHFATLAADSRTRCVGDMTPAYAILPAAAFAQWRNAVTARHLKPLIVFTLRDPVERLWSAVRMRRRLTNTSDIPEAEELRAHASHPSAIKRTAYHVTLANIESVFHPNEIFVALYEELISAAEIQRLTQAIGIDFIAPDLTTRLNHTPKSHAIPPELEREIALLHHNVYTECFRRFGEAKLRALWPSARFIPSPPP
jgi:hypothetical protein